MASESWSGFTDEDIERIKSNSTNSALCSDKSCEEAAMIQTRGPMKIKRSVSETFEEVNLSTVPNNTDPSCKGKRVAQNCKNKYVKPTRSEKKTNSEREICDQTYDYQCLDTVDAAAEEDRFTKENISITDPENEMHLPSLELFELKQKRIEAENARRRALISKAITDKKKRTLAEAAKLNKITYELDRLDSILSADVSILRDYIEKASLEFTEAEKRYLKAEKEFVEAKLSLFEKMQRKQQLTEHLCAIIEQNENRKANKLVELMKQLEMEAVMEDYEINDIEPILSNLCILNDEAYHSCQTLKTCSPDSKKSSPSPEQNIQNELKNNECHATEDDENGQSESPEGSDFKKEVT
ncbi:RAB6-interacting golgin-like [Uloborus diversus]|uniref:RAB6-interacting golgin-like n=1 Tax=Uloborus diversus TaxID=327109 RepID=UPI00240A5A70|nr:RAB6-interacting golgin-like [Uloborus diversus]